MKNDKYDWVTLQAYYDLGNSWHAVSKKFNVFNLSKAVKQGLLVSRSRGESISLATGGNGNATSLANCKSCGKEFQYRTQSSGGRYCSNRCRHDHQWSSVTVPRVLSGTASHETLKKYHLTISTNCSNCDIKPVWDNKPLILQLDHVDGNSDNNTVSNTRLLCPNCHSQTTNFGIKNKGQVSKRNSRMKTYRGRLDE